MSCNLLIFNIILLANVLSIDVHASCRVSEQTYCRTSSGEPARRNTFYQNSVPQDSFFKLLQQESLQKVETLRNDPTFQGIVTELQNNTSKDSSAFKDASKEVNGELYIFISFSLGEKALLNLAHEAKRFGATLVLRGFREGSYLKTAQALQKIILKTGQGIIIDPELYSLFNVTAVPTFVLAKPFPLQSQERTQTPIHDKLQGHVSTHYALETFVERGDLKEEVHELLSRGAIK